MHVQYMVQDPDAVFKKLQDDFHGGEEIPELTPVLREHLVRNVRRRMTPQPLKIRADVELTCFAYDGVLHIQVLCHDGLRCQSLPVLLWQLGLAKGFHEVAMRAVCSHQGTAVSPACGSMVCTSYTLWQAARQCCHSQKFGWEYEQSEAVYAQRL